MMIKPRPPHYLTEDEFDRLRFSEEQEMALEARFTATLREGREEEQKRFQKRLEGERFARPIMCLLAGIVLSLLFFGVLDAVFNADLSSLANHPVPLFIATGIAAYTMRKK